MRSVRSRTSLGYRLSCPGRLCSVHHNESSLALISIALFQYHARKHLQLSERVLRSLRRHQSSGVSGRHRRAHAACGNQLGREAIGRHGQESGQKPRHAELLHVRIEWTLDQRRVARGARGGRGQAAEQVSHCVDSVHCKARSHHRARAHQGGHTGGTALVGL